MNLHVFNDGYGLYPDKVAERILNLNSSNNSIINITNTVSILNDSIELLSPTESSIKEYIKKLVSIDKVLLHPVTYESSYFLLELKNKFPNVKVFWVSWSYDIYNYHMPLSRLYLPFSLRFARKNMMSRLRYFIIKSGLIYIRSIFFPFKSQFKLEKAYDLVDYFCSFLEEDFKVAQSVSKNTRMQYLPIAYLSIDQIINTKSPYKSIGNSIMLGHASSLESNHFEMIELLSELNKRSTYLIPLAYGNEEYKNKIIEVANSKLAGELEIIETKLSSEDYYLKLQNVQHAIFNLRVQQALGNILGLLYIGAKIYLREETSTFQQFKKWGLFVYSYESLVSEIGQGLSDVEAAHNKERILQLFNEKQVNLFWQPLLN